MGLVLRSENMIFAGNDLIIHNRIIIDQLFFINQILSGQSSHLRSTIFWFVSLDRNSISCAVFDAERTHIFYHFLFFSFSSCFTFDMFSQTFSLDHLWNYGFHHFLSCILEKLRILSQHLIINFLFD